MPHAIDLRRLDHLGRLLAGALEQKDWARVGEIDRLIRQGLQRLSANGQPGADLQARLAPLKACYARARQTCMREHQRLGDLLGSLAQHGEGRLAYSLLDSVQEEGQA
ncbi:hypothetical protein [Pseudomonas fragi]|uniref:hypothetical protein n=1 Tax=Pseudomonas fragi TaxID=296 RepID=UPI00391858E3